MKHELCSVFSDCRKCEANRLRVLEQMGNINPLRSQTVTPDDSSVHVQTDRADRRRLVRRGLSVQLPLVNK